VALFNLCYVFHIVFIKHLKMVYCVAYNCAKKHTSNINDYIRSVSAVKTRPERTTPTGQKAYKQAVALRDVWQS